MYLTFWVVLDTETMGCEHALRLPLPSRPAEPATRKVWSRLEGSGVRWCGARGGGEGRHKRVGQGVGPTGAAGDKKNAGFLSQFSLLPSGAG